MLQITHHISPFDRVIHHSALWKRRLSHKLKANRHDRKPQIDICKPQMPQSVLNALIQQGFSLKMSGNLANYRDNPRIFKGNVEFRVTKCETAGQNVFWWAVPVEGEKADGTPIFPVPFIRNPQADSR